MIASLDFCVIKFAMKLFKTANRPFIVDCISYFGFCLPSVLIERRTKRFFSRLKLSARFNTLIFRYVE